VRRYRKEDVDRELPGSLRDDLKRAHGDCSAEVGCADFAKNVFSLKVKAEPFHMHFARSNGKKISASFHFKLFRFYHSEIKTVFFRYVSLINNFSFRFYLLFCFKAEQNQVFLLLFT
jgi:hypothetical protein